MRLLVVGGSLGAKALNDTVPQALALLPAGERPVVIHQSGEKQIDALKANYAAAGVQADLHVWDGMWHAFFSDPELPESQEAYAVTAAFFDRHLGR